MKKLMLALLLASVAPMPAACLAETTNTVCDVTSLTNALATLQPPCCILLEKGVYDVSDCSGELQGGYVHGHLSFGSTGKTVTLAGAPGTRRGDVVITAPTGAGKRLIWVNKGRLTLENLTLTGAAGGGIRFGNADSLLTATDCVFSNLTASAAAVVSRYYTGVQTQVPDVYRNCLFADNHATTEGGGCLNARGAVAYGCVFSNNTAKSAGGAVLAGSYVNCLFVSNSVSAATTSTGGGAIGSDYDVNAGFCTGCTFVGNSIEGQGHGGAVHRATALTNCVFRGNLASANGILGTVSDGMVGCLLQDNRSLAVIVESSASVSRCVFSGNTSATRLVFGTSIYANCLVVSNHSADAQGIMDGRFYNCTFVGNYCNSNRASDSIVTADSTAINCLFYQNRAHGATYLDMALRFVGNDLVTPLSPHMTNCLWTADTTFDQAHKDAALARTLNAERREASRFRFVGSGADPYALAGGRVAHYPGFLDDDVRANVGETDLAGNPRIGGGNAGEYITLGCYQWVPSGSAIVFR